jgi:hypothetical protein
MFIQNQVDIAYEKKTSIRKKWGAPNFDWLKVIERLVPGLHSDPENFSPLTLIWFLNNKKACIDTV